MFDRLRSPALRLTMPFLLYVLLFGCGSKVNQENFDKIKTGMTLEEVKTILGEPGETSSVGLGPMSGTSAIWKTKGGRVSIQFVNNKATIKSFTKGE
jgi:hypothetical protein